MSISITCDGYVILGVVAALTVVPLIANFFKK